MKFQTHGNGNGLDDLYILPESEEEKKHIKKVLEAQMMYYSWTVSNVRGQEWFGKGFFDVPFGEFLKDLLTEV